MKKFTMTAQLAVMAACMQTQTKIRPTCPSREPRFNGLTKPQTELLEEKRKLAAEVRRARKAAKRAGRT